MKKILISLFAVIAVISLSACSSSSNSKKEETKKMEPSFEIIATKDEQENNTIKANEGSVFKTLTIEAKNIDRDYSYEMIEIPSWKGTEFGYISNSTGDISSDSKFEVTLHVQNGFVLNNINLKYFPKGNKNKDNTKQVTVTNKTS